MFRKDLIDLLLNKPMSVVQMARGLRESPRDVAHGLEHLFKSLRHTEYRAVVTPAECRKCGFVFPETKLTKPSKCPKCRSTWMTEPLIEISRHAS